MAINSDTESADDTSDDEDLRVAKASIYSRTLMQSRRKLSSDEDDFKSESDY